MYLDLESGSWAFKFGLVEKVALSVVLEREDVFYEKCIQINLSSDQNILEGNLLLLIPIQQNNFIVKDFLTICYREMVDWPGLLNWTLKYHGKMFYFNLSLDGTKPSDVQPLTGEDRKWLEEALDAYTFDEVKLIEFYNISGQKDERNN